MLNSLMQVAINAPDSAQCSDVVKSSVDNWLKKEAKKETKEDLNCEITAWSQSGGRWSFRQTVSWKLNLDARRLRMRMSMWLLRMKRQKLIQQPLASLTFIMTRLLKVTVTQIWSFSDEDHPLQNSSQNDSVDSPKWLNRKWQSFFTNPPYEMAKF